MNKKTISLITTLMLLTSFAQGAGNNLRPNMTAEKCLLTKSTYAPGSKYKALAGVSAINIFGELPIQAMGNISNGSKIPNQNTSITFSTRTTGDQLFQTIQSTQLLEKDGRPIDVNKFDGDTLLNLYSHSFESKTTGRTLKMIATHTVVQFVDHWYSKDVVVDYSQEDRTPGGTSFVKGSFYFKCNAYNDAVDALK